MQYGASLLLYELSIKQIRTLSLFSFEYESGWIGGHNRTNIQTLRTDFRQKYNLSLWGSVIDVRLVLLPPVA